MEEIKQFDVKTISHGWMIIEYLIHSYSLFSCPIVLQSTESKLTFHVSRCMGELCYVPILEYRISANSFREIYSFLNP